jgi:hypothetical protein
MQSWSRRKPDELDAARTRTSSGRGREVADVDPLLHLQATAGNLAVTGLLHPRTGTGTVTIQREDTDEDDDTASGDQPAEEGPAEDSGDAGGGAGPAPDGEGAPDGSSDSDASGAFGAVEAEVTTTLEPGSVKDTLSQFENPDQGPGDFNVPDNSVVAQALRIQRDNTPEEPAPTRAASAGDLIKAFKPFLDPALKFLEENVLAALKKIKAGEAVVTVVVAAPILIGPLTQPGPRRLALDQLDGTDITFGVIPNLQLKPQISDGQLKGGTLTYDLAPALRKAGIPF